MNKKPTSHRLTPEALILLKAIAKKKGLNQTSTLEVIIRQVADDLNIQVQTLSKSEKQESSPND